MCSLFNFAEVNALRWIVCWSLHLHELKETNQHEEQDRQHNQNTHQGVGVQVLLYSGVGCRVSLEACLSERHSLGLLETSEDDLIGVVTFAAHDAHYVVCNANRLKRLLNLLGDLINKCIGDALSDINDVDLESPLFGLH